jgi:acyl carrier protein
MTTREQVMEDVLMLLRKVSDDWEYTGEITPETRFFADMGLQSLDVVVLGTAVQEHYGQVLPFMKLFAEMGQRSLPDIPVSEWVDFIHRELGEAERESGRADDEVASANGGSR